ncbi:ankyrin repeat and SOCS box protein 2-like isoform X3 [Nerophis ophidion]|uniref:ankyrin repeat and SOCS box protein 2-like isoform X3 n=1 Tax=Nerophis ophidion TaxID=159077 RepID=UPI002ADF8CD0|nr:ankyrin repeat and SOCS box protein 2-like isoform X3 [Nerophis ophidion]
MASAGVPHTATLDDYSVYGNLSDDELLQLAVERSLADAHASSTLNTILQLPDSKVNTNDCCQISPVQKTAAHYSSPNPPSEKPPDLRGGVFWSGLPKKQGNTVQCRQMDLVQHLVESLPRRVEAVPAAKKNFDGTVSCFMTGYGQKMLAYRSSDGTLVHVAPELQEEEEPLFAAIRVGDVDRVKALIRGSGNNLMLPSKPGWLAIHQAVWYDQEACLRILLSGADINSEAADGGTALYEASKNLHVDTVKFLLSQKADANKSGKTSLLPLHIAAQRGSDVVVSLLIPATSKARVRRCGISPLHVAAERNRDDVLEILIAAGFDVNAQLSEERSKLYEDRRSTALYFAVINNNIDNVRLLLQSGADPNLDVFRPLMVAARQGCIEIVTLLVEHGADINACIPTHPTTFPAIYMFSMKYLPLFKYLLDNGGQALSCFHCLYGTGPHPSLQTSRPHRGHLGYPERDYYVGRSVQFCEIISAPTISRWAGPIIDILLDYVGNVTLCSRLLEHLDSFEDWAVIKEKAAVPRPLQQLCRVLIVKMVGTRRLKRLPLPGGLIRFLQHQESYVDV